MHRLTFVVTIAAALVACGDDTGAAGAGGSGGSGGGGQGGDGATTSATTATTSTSSSDGGAGGGSTGAGGSEDFTSLIEACEDLDTALNAAAAASDLECSIDSDCEGLPAQFPGCEAETEALVTCQASDFDAADCVCAGDDLDCGIFTICTPELDAFTSCREAEGG